MEHINVLCGFFVLVIFSKGLSAYIQTQQSVLAAPGEQVSLSCQLTQSEDVEEVEWRKILNDGEKSLSSSHKLHGRKVDPEFEERMEFRFDGFHDCSVGLKATEQDEGCYRCVFKTKPEGLLTNKTCLWTYELHEPILQVREPEFPKPAIVSCSATGRPDPAVTLTVKHPGLYFSQNNTFRVHNNNNTVTVITMAVLSGYHDDSTQVGCTVRVLPGPQLEGNQRIPERIKQSFQTIYVPSWFRLPLKTVLPWVALFAFCIMLIYFCVIYVPQLIWKCTCHFVEKIFEEPEV